MTPRTDLTANELCLFLNANPQGCNQFGCKAGTGRKTPLESGLDFKIRSRLYEGEKKLGGGYTRVTKGTTETTRQRRAALKTSKRTEAGRKKRDKAAGLMKKARSVTPVDRKSRLASKAWAEEFFNRK